ncbi:MAG: hypothetical protein Q3976_00330 [Corynebacterium sp.]|nr:hypothetical protein [Corynebacterium sp.]
MTVRKRRRSQRPADSGNPEYEDSTGDFFQDLQPPISAQYYKEQQPPHYGKTE